MSCSWDFQASTGILAANVSTLKVDKTHFQECVLDMLGEMFGEDCVGKLVKSDKVQITVNGVEATVNMTSCVSISSCLLSISSLVN